MTIDIDAAMRAGTEPRRSQKWVDALPAETQQQLTQLRERLRAARNRGEKANNAAISRAVQEQLRAANLPCPAIYKTIGEWLND